MPVPRLLLSFQTYVVLLEEKRTAAGEKVCWEDAELELGENEDILDHIEECLDDFEHTMEVWTIIFLDNIFTDVYNTKNAFF